MEERVILIDEARAELTLCHQAMSWNKQVGVTMEKEAKINHWLRKISDAYDSFRTTARCDCELIASKYSMINGLGLHAAREQECGFLTYRFSENLRKAYSACVKASMPTQKCVEPEVALSGYMF